MVLIVKGVMLLLSDIDPRGAPGWDGRRRPDNRDLTSGGKIGHDAAMTWLFASLLLLRCPAS